MEASNQAKGVILTNQDDWERWILMIRMTALELGVWKYINPDLEGTPPMPIEPIRPTPIQAIGRIEVEPAVGNQPAVYRDPTIQDLDASGRELLRFLLEEWKIEVMKYENSMKGIRRIRTEIQNTVGRESSAALRDEDPYKTLLQLKDRFRPTDYAHGEILRAKWLNLANTKGIKNHEEWIQSWLTTYDDCLASGLPDVQGNYPKNTFIRSIKTIHPAFAIPYDVDLARGDLNSTPFSQLISEYRNWYRNNEAIKTAYPKAYAYSASFDQSPDQSKSTPTPTLNGKDKNGNQRICLCGDSHGWKKCPYLFDINQPSDWTPNKEIQDMITKKREKHIGLQKALEKISNQLNKKSEKNSPVQANSMPRAAISMNLAYHTTANSVNSTNSSSSVYALANSYILDCGATDHVCNNKERFLDFKAEKGVMVTGSNTVNIEGWGTAIVKLRRSGDSIDFKLLNCAYIPSFTTNLVAFRKLRNTGIKWNQDDFHLYWNGALHSETVVKYDQWCLEYTPISDYSAFPANRSIQPKSSITWTMDQAHARLGDLNKEAIRHVPKASIDIELITGELTEPCETCRICDAKALISRRPGERGTTPFERVGWDVIHLKDGLLSHFIDENTGFHMIYYCKSTSANELIQSFKHLLNTAKTQWGFNVKILRIDGQQSLIESNEWAEFITNHGIKIEISAPDVHAQNGLAERSGGVIINTARKLRHRSNLPMTMWKEIIATAVYLLNRSPRRSLNWSTPISKLQNTPIKLGHLMPLGSRAYVLKNNIPKLDKLEPRAHIGYLVGYDSSNIFRVWVPTRNMVIRTRDVTFDESKQYSHTDEIDEFASTSVKTADLIEIDENQESMTQELQPWEISIDDIGDTIVIDSGQGIDHGKAYDRTNQLVDRSNQLLTPELTPDRDIDEIATSEREITTSRDRENIQNNDQQPPTAYYTSYLAAFNVQYREKNKRIHNSELPAAPDGWYGLKNHQFRDEFKNAAKQELEELQNRQTFEQNDEQDAKGFVIPTRWVFTYKCDEEGYLVKFKARLVVRGDLQPENNEETYAATLAIRIFRYLMALTAYFRLQTHQYDAINAFPNAKLNRKVWIKYPPGFGVNNKVLLLHRALYGLRISPLLWHTLLCVVMGELGLNPIAECPCLFISKKLIVFFYVDDIVVLYHHTNQSAFDRFHQRIIERFRIRNIGQLKWFLGIRIIREYQNGLLWLCQDAHIAKLASEWGLIGKASSPLPTTPLIKSDQTSPDDRIKRFQRKVGAIGYLATTTRPDCAKAHSKLAEFLRNPGIEHEEAVDRCILFLYHTRFQALEYGSIRQGAPIFYGASDASFADDTNTRMSTEGFLFQLFGGTIDWKSTLQKTVTTSSTEAELLALYHIGTWLMWWRRLFDQMNFDIDSDDPLLCDNQQTVRLMVKESPKLITKLKHVDIHQHWLRQECESGNISINWINTTHMPADGLTKPLGPQKHRDFMRQLSMVNISGKIGGDISPTN